MRFFASIFLFIPIYYLFFYTPYIFRKSKERLSCEQVTGGTTNGKYGSDALASFIEKTDGDLNKFFYFLSASGFVLRNISNKQDNTELFVFHAIDVRTPCALYDRVLIYSPIGDKILIKAIVDQNRKVKSAVFG